MRHRMVEESSGAIHTKSMALSISLVPGPVAGQIRHKSYLHRQEKELTKE